MSDVDAILKALENARREFAEQCEKLERKLDDSSRKLDRMLARFDERVEVKKPEERRPPAHQSGCLHEEPCPCCSPAFRGKDCECVAGCNQTCNGAGRELGVQYEGGE